MSSIRRIGRWTLTLLAVLLALVALALTTLRVTLSQVDQLTPRAERLLEARTGAAVDLNEFRARLARLDPVIEGSGLTLTSQEGEAGLPLLEVEHARLRLDTPASLRNGVPVVEDARLTGLTLHLYQDDQGGWHWPDPARIPPELLEGDFKFEQLDTWIGLLLRQRAWVEDVRLVLHGRDRRVDLLAPRLLLTGDERRAHLEGEVHLTGQEQATLQAALEVFPGPTGLRDFSAALQAEMKLGTLIDLVEVFTPNDPLRLEDASGDVTLWGRWHRGALADARVDLDVPRLALSRDDEPIVLEPFQARGQWLRSDQGWEAWLQGDATAADWSEPRELERAREPALPHFWHVRSDDEGWWLTTSRFELASLAAWRERILLPEGLVRTIDALQPRGLVSGLGVGRRNGQWVARAAVHQVEVEPWEAVPGGGPLDAWVEARDLSGRVEFVGVGEPTFKVPQLYEVPMSLSHASGEVRWTYEGPRTFVSGRQLKAGWQGADVEGNFGLALGGDVHGGLGLDLRFRDADALERPLVDWLPGDALGEELYAWLAAGVAGRVPQGELKLHLPLRRGGSGLEPRLQLDLEIEEGRLSFDPEWPEIESLGGRLTAGIGTLEAEVDHAESLGVEAGNGQVSIADDVLRVSGDLTADGEALRRYLRAVPADGMEQVDDWRGEGGASGRIELATRLGEEEGFELDLDTEVALERLVYLPLEVPFTEVGGPLAWRQRDDEGGLEGQLAARLFGGPVEADIDTHAGSVEFDGAADVASMVSRFEVDELGDKLSGRLPWRGRLSLDETGSTFRFDSNLQGVGIDLPAPLGKAAGESRPLWVTADLDQQRIDAELGGDARLRWRALPGSDLGQGQFWLGRLPESPAWPDQEGWSGSLYFPRLDPVEWGEALSPLLGGGASAGSGGPGALRRLQVGTACLAGPEACLGAMSAEARPHAGGGWRVGLEGDLLEGQLDFRPSLSDPLDIALERLSLDGLLPAQTEGAGNLLQELEVPPDPAPLPGWLTDLPDGRLRIADILHQGRQIGPLTAHWEGGPQRLRLAPVGLTLGQVTARGEIVWESAGAGDSLTRSRVDLDGRDLGTALERLGQPVSIHSNETRVRSQLAWPGAPWQFALARSRGSIEVELRDGRFVNLESPTARLVGLLNVDNLLRRLRMDFSDVTGQGTAFDRVTGAATLYEGVLETNGPVTIDGPATAFTLDGTVDLVQGELDQRLGVTVPVSSSLPLAAVIAGAPVVGGALYLADRLFGKAIDRVTRIHYRVRGPWTSPDITLETAE
ncbi:YhdP family protein [Billgrantia lactosivorans]|uniref:YhdP family phospholipid transporter n=1 Tax=Billgrantia lactosivorans TaxID=2185141 RepID=UPI000DAB4456|nr:AsmA-like C-terminal region-containing protein [Halomonas lactosivorans]